MIYYILYFKILYIKMLGMYIAHIYFFIVSCVLSYFLQCVLFCNSLQLQSYVFPTSKTKVVAIWKSQQQKLCSVHLFAIRRSMCADLQLSKLVLWQWTNPTSSTRWCMFLHFPKMTSGAGLCMCDAIRKKSLQKKSLTLIEKVF